MENYSSEHLFRPGRTELLAATRDAYLRGLLAPADAAAVEAVLRRDAVERGVALGRSHELAALAARQQPAQAFVPPAWVQQELRRQPSVSAWGPLRRPSIQLALGLLLLLSGASIVQGIRNKPLVPAPVVASLKQATRTLSRATRQLVSSAPLPAETAADSASWLALVPTATARASRSLASPRKPEVPKAAARPAPAPAGRTTDSTALAATALSSQRPELLALRDSATASGADASVASDAPTGLGAVGGASAPRPTQLVRGHVLDARGRPLAGATILIKGTGRATSTNAKGEYELEAPAGAELQVGYAGYADRLLVPPPAGSSAQDVTLEPVAGAGRRGGPRR